MIDPLECAQTLYACCPDEVATLLDLFLWSRTATGSIADAQAERVEQFLHSRTDHGNRARNEYRSSRVGKAKVKKGGKITQLPMR